MSRYPRPREELEERLVAEYLAAAHPDAQHMIRVRLGPLPAGAPVGPDERWRETIYGVARHWGDGLAIYPDRLVLLEAKLKLSPDALGQLLVYHDLIEQTPELMPYVGRPRTLECVYAFGDEDTERILREHGINPVRFAPAWAVEAYLKRARREVP